MRNSRVHPAMPLLLASLTLTLACAADGLIIPETTTSQPPPVEAPPVTPPVDPSGNAGPGEPELPRVFLDTRESATPSTGRTLHVLAGGDLQAALDTAKLGDRILLAAGATFTGNFVLPATTAGIADNWITVRTEGQLPAEGTRMTATQAAALNLPKLVSNTLLPAIRTAAGANHWRFMGVEITSSTTLTTSQGLVWLGDGSTQQNDLSMVPSDLIFDRVYVHGQPALDMRRCFSFNSARTAVVDSYVSECHSAFDAQAIGGWNGPGPFKIVNNYLEAAAEVIAFGGSDPALAQLVPSDIEIRRNHVTKPLSWNGKWLTKNLIEFKAGRRVLIEGNVMENSWPDGQAGFAVVLWSANQNGACTWCVTEDVTVRDNLIRNVSSGFQLTAKYKLQPSPVLQRVAIRNNVMLGINVPQTPGYGRLFQITDSIPNLIIEHNTAFSPTNSSVIWAGSVPLTGLLLRNNLMGGGQYQLFSAEGQGQVAWSVYGGQNSEFLGNVVALAPDGTSPAGNFYPATMDGVGLSGGAAAAFSASVSPSDVALSASSTYKNKGTDGRDPGADVAVLTTAIAGVVQP
jgi:hypothetical protein